MTKVGVSAPHSNSDDESFISTCASTISKVAGRKGTANCTQTLENSVQKCHMSLQLVFYLPKQTIWLHPMSRRVRTERGTGIMVSLMTALVTGCILKYKCNDSLSYLTLLLPFSHV